MKINISEIYKKNILDKYDCDNEDEYDAKYTTKQQDMWEMTLQLLKDNYPKEIYDDNNPSDMEYLKDYHAICMTDEDFTHFTLSEWFSYMKSQE